MNKEIENGFMLIALKPFNARGLSYKVGDRVSARMTFTQAIKKSKQYNIGHTVGCDKTVEVNLILILNQVGRNRREHNEKRYLWSLLGSFRFN